MKPGTKTGPQPRAQETTRPRPKRVEPFSPWQKLVDQRMIELQVTTRALTEKISTAKRKFAHTTLWAWLRSVEGCPPKETYTADINRKLAIALEIKPDVLAQAYERSRQHLIIGDPQAGTRGPLSVLRRLFADSPKDTWKKAEIVQLIDDITGL